MKIFPSVVVAVISHSVAALVDASDRLVRLPRHSRLLHAPDPNLSNNRSKFMYIRTNFHTYAQAVDSWQLIFNGSNIFLKVHVFSSFCW